MPIRDDQDAAAAERERRGVVDGRLRDVLAAHQPLLALREALAFDEPFRGRVEAVRSGKLEADVAARPYAWNGGKTLAVMREVIVRVAASSASDLTFAILNFPPVPGGDAEAPSTAPRWKKGGDYRSAADRLMRLGSGLCLADGCWRRTDTTGQPHRTRIRYCIDHSTGSEDGWSYEQMWERRDREAIRELLVAVGDVLGI